jgi:pimeloyl-ACP methyl ester carboxylesterase
MPTFQHAGHRLHYTEFGTGERVVVLVHGLWLTQRVYEPLARELAARGHRVLCLDLLGHGASDRPAQMSAYADGIDGFGGQVIALLDHAGAHRAAVGGVSLGANVALAAGAQAPDRVSALVLEMPALDHARRACWAFFTPVFLTLLLGTPLLRRFAATARRMAPRGDFWRDVAFDLARQDPLPAAVVTGALLRRGFAPSAVGRRAITAPALVLAHHGDPIHPFADAQALEHELSDARIVVAESAMELRRDPQRLTAEIAAFLDASWSARNGDH